MNASTRRIGRGIGCASAMVVALAASLCRAPTLRAQEIAVPVETQVPLLVKILTFDRNLVGGAESEIVMGVLYQGKYRTSAIVADDVRDAIKRLPITAGGSRRVRSVPIDLDETASLEAALAKYQVTVLYVTPLRAVDLKILMTASRASRVTTVTGVLEYVAMGLAIGIGIKRERPEIVINLAASRAEGADLNAQVLKLARIVQ